MKHDPVPDCLCSECQRRRSHSLTLSGRTQKLIDDLKSIPFPPGPGMERRQVELWVTPDTIKAFQIKHGAYQISSQKSAMNSEKIIVSFEVPAEEPEKEYRISGSDFQKLMDQFEEDEIPTDIIRKMFKMADQ